MKTTVEVIQHGTKLIVDLVGADRELSISAVRFPSAEDGDSDSTDVSKWIDNVAPDIWNDLTDLAIAAYIKHLRFCGLKVAV